MSVKLVHITAPIAAEASLQKLARESAAVSFEKVADIEGEHAIYLAVAGSENRQAFVDALHAITQTSPRSRIVISPVETVLPSVEARKKSDTREELMLRIWDGVEITRTYLVLTLLSTIVALIGLLNDNVAVVIGAMVIAPLLGPNLGLAFGTVLGYGKLIRKSALTGLAGLVPAILLSAAIGALWGSVPQTGELMDRTAVGYDAIILAFASGLAGVLSLVTGLSMTMVGVMVAVALLPPAATFGFMIGAGDYELAVGALELLVINIVCVNLSGLLVFFLNGIGPRETFRKKFAHKMLFAGVSFWGILLTTMIYIVFYQS